MGRLRVCCGVIMGWIEHDLPEPLRTKVRQADAAQNRPRTAKAHNLGEIELKQPLDSWPEIKGKKPFGAGSESGATAGSEPRAEATNPLEGVSIARQGSRSSTPQQRTPSLPASNSARPARPSYNRKIVEEWFLQRNIPPVCFEYQFAFGRKWRFDLAWPAQMVALEVQGGTWRKGGGAHRGTGALRDMEKFSEAACLGWRILYCQPKDLCTVAVADLIKRALEAK